MTVKVLNKVAQLLLLSVALLAVMAGEARTNDSTLELGPGLEPGLGLGPIQLAQFDADDTYDPFADYSEFDEAQDEEADINFFRNGRFVTVGFTGGFRGFTEGLGDMYKTSPAFGLYLSYFFDLRFALQFSFLTSDHSFAVSGGSQTGTGNVGITSFGLDLKYYINTQNVTKGLAKFNPYFIGGFARVDRTTNIDGVADSAKKVRWPSTSEPASNCP